MAVTLVAFMALASSGWAYNSSWNYSTTAKDEGQQSDGGNYTFRYTSSETKDKMMGFKTYYMFDVKNHMFKWNWDIKVNYGTVDDKNFTHVYVTIEDADGYRRTIAEADFVGYKQPTVLYADRPVYFSRIKDSGTYKYMFTLEYQPTPYDLKEGVRRIYIHCRTTWDGGNQVRNFQYERDLDISSYTNMVPDYSCELDGEGNYLFKVNGTPAVDNNKDYLAKYFSGKVSYGRSNYSNEWVRYDLTEENRTGGSDDNANYTITVPVKSYTVPLRLSQLEYTIDVKKQVYSSGSSEHYEYSVQPSSGDAYYEGILFKPYTRVENISAEFNKWKKKNVIQWTRTQKVSDYYHYTSVDVDCQTDGTWYVLRYEKGQPATSYEILKEIAGSSTNLKVEDSEIEYDKEYVYRVVFLPRILKDKFADRLVNLPGEGANHTQYDLWEEVTVNTEMKVPIKLAQDRSDDTGIHLTWGYNVQESGCEWRIDKHLLGQTTWTPVTTLPVDTRQSSAQYVEKGGSVCDLYVYRVMTMINDKELYSDTLVCNLPAGAYISEVKATTGEETNVVKVTWKVARPGDDDIWFRVLRRPIGSDEWTLLSDTEHGHASEYTYTDERVLAGSYYEYSVEAYGAKCEEQLVQTDRCVAPGFSQARGTITGHISYGTGTAVGGARVNLVKTSAAEDTDQPQFLSRFIEGEGKGLQWRGYSTKYAGDLNGRKALTLQLWARPHITEGNSQQSLLTLANALELGVMDSGSGKYHLFAIDKTDPDNFLMVYPNMVFDLSDFTHITATYSDGFWTFYAGNDTLHTGRLKVKSTAWNACSASTDITLSIGGSNRSIGNAYTGYVDDVRLWNRALTEKEINDNYTRILGGTEKGLVLYWPMDEGMHVTDYVFDVSYQDGLSNLNHPEMGVNALPSAIVPSAKYLGLYGVTDLEGDYIIRGIPFQQGGTNYKLAPELGIHEFSPNTRSMFISPTSLTANNIDFEDVSSFPMSGYVYYAGTNIPVEGAMLYVDGTLMSGNGEVKKTDSNGYYEISVPIGEHFVEAKLEGHKMVAGGRFPTVGTFNFDRRMQYDFTDSTLVNFVGRVSGGVRNDTLAVGFGASNNNIGMATIMLKLNNASFSFNCKDDHISDAATPRMWESDTISIASRAWTGVGNEAKYIYIRTDSLTGEFSALLPPLKYITKSIRVDSNPDIEFNSLPEINLTRVSTQRTDSIIETNGDIHRYKYHEKMIRTHFAEPQIDVRQMNYSMTGVYGEQEINDYPLDADTTVDIQNIWTLQGNGEVKYNYTYPIFAQYNSYKFMLHGYEVYVNHDSGEAVVDSIPMNDQKLTIGNEMSENQAVVNRIDEGVETDLQVGDINQLKSDEVLLDENGYAGLSWKAGFPNIVTPYTRQFHVNFVRSDRNYAMTPVEGIVLGALPMGNNFVTKGPEVPLMILRDPPGAKSKTTWKSGTVKTKTRTRSTCWVNNIKTSFENVYGTKITTASGVGLALVSVNNITWNNHEVLTYNHNLGAVHEQTWATTTTQSVSTGTDPFHVGSNGDVFIGVSKNILLGDCRKVGFFRDGNGFKIDMRDSKCLSDSIKTTFMYSTYELETVMIPKWEELRDSMLVRKATKIECENYQPSDNESIYLTWEQPGTENYGKEGHYIWKTGKNVKAQNEVHWYNHQIDLWLQLLARNEEDKVIAIEDSGQRFWQKNISFDGGTSYSYGVRRDTTDVWKDFYSGSATFAFDFSTNIRINSAAEMATNLTFGFEEGVKWDNSGSDADENVKDYAEFAYDFVDGNVDTQFSVDIYKSPAGFSDIFRLFGGQSYNPYEGEEKTKYYQKGQHTLSNGTVRMEQPNMSISVGGQNPTKNLTVTDIPSGQEMNLTLHCSNMANVHQGLDFSYNVVIVEKTNTKGLQILMDGVPINGRSIRIPQSETVTKQITIRQTDESILDYEGIKLRFCSQYQAPVLYDEVTLNAHFVPSSSPIDLVIAEPVMNIENLDLNKGNLVMKLTNFNRLFKNLRYVGLQYRYEGNTQWNTLHTYVTNKADSLGPSYSPLPETSSLLYTYNMKDDNLFPQGTYFFRAFTTTPYGKNPNDAATVYSSEITVIKDNQRPRNLTTPTPANGILRYGDDISIEFNEDIVPGYVSDKNIIVTAKLNNQPVNHDVALELIPYGSSAHTKNPIFLNGDFSMEFWVKWSVGGVLIRQGKSFSMLSMRINNEGKVLASLGGNSYTSSGVIPKDTWTYIVISYKSSDMTFSALAQYGTESVELFNKQPVTFSAVESISYTDDNLLYLGSGITAAIHDMALYNIYRDVHDAAAAKYVSKDQYVYGLTNYWPMNEGHGTVAADSRHTHDFMVNDRWELSNENYCIDANKAEGASADISRINTSPGDSYAIELWALAHNGACTLLETGSVASNKICLRYDANMNLLLDYGEKSQVVASHNDFPSHSTWHHLALNVVRGQAASFYYNGRRTAVIAEVDMPPLEGSQMKLGTGLNGKLDELRIWHATLTEDRLLTNLYNCIDTADVYSRGLVAYYPFEKRETVNGIPTYVGTLEDMAPANSVPDHAFIVKQSALSLYGPPLKKPVEESRVIAKPVASERKIVIRLEEGSGIKARDIEGTKLNVTVDKIFDQHGNQSLPIRWTSFVQLNTLRWMQDSVNVFKQYGDEYTFDVDIENRSGNTEYYTLYNMPQWLSLVDSEQTDDVMPLKTKTLRFQVDPLVPVGNYDLTIGLQGNNEILEPLRVVMKVRGEMPAWSVDPTQYENHMSVIGQVYINGILMENRESRVAAFIGDECRGIASPEQVRNGAFVTMTVYGTGTATSDLNKPVTFRIWDASTGMAYADVNITLPDQEAQPCLSFCPDELIGDFNSPVVWTKGDKVEQLLHLNKKWNWIALGVEPDDQRPVSVFPLLTSWKTLIKNKRNAVVYSNGAEWRGSLMVEPATMYKMSLEWLDNAQDISQGVTVTGRQLVLAETPITLNHEWNWIGYTPLNTMTVGEALAGANPQRGDRIKSQTAIAIYNGTTWDGSLKSLEPGHGYMYYSTYNATKTFVYPTSDDVTHRAPALLRSAPPVVFKNFTPVGGSDYPDNMTMVIQLMDGDAIVDTCEVAAFIEDECRGAARADDGLYYLIIAGEGGGQPVDIRTCIDGEIISIDNSYVYASDQNIGTPWEPVVINLRKVATGIYAFGETTDDDTEWYTLQGFKIGRKPVQPGVYIHNGQKVTILRKRIP